VVLCSPPAFDQQLSDVAASFKPSAAGIGDVLVTSDGLLSPEISPDQLHLTARGYALLTARLEPELDRWLSAEH
jgi:hypothetical protein